ncbi:uncharacterized protein A4U43_C02F3940 [Asparagus officinalis]|uniref:Uncharacterized protein n=1 Tax=Asparagus officinalis TaxID=4686 RepID=A0A5P1FGF0_ASPOF|nr:uncharacterized protein A4U43_C02F3940 [Asparagus officinalis]
MVLHKRLNYGSSGYRVPPMPRVPRSARGKRSVRKKVDDKKQISAFDLLATVAGELLSPERENSPPPCKISTGANIKQEQQDNEIPFKAEVFDQGSCNESALGSSESMFKRQVATIVSIAYTSAFEYNSIVASFNELMDLPDIVLYLRVSLTK